jgi:hypothetical protein
MPSFGRQQPTAQFGRTGILPTVVEIVAPTAGEQGPAGQNAPIIVTTDVLKNNGFVTLINYFSDGNIQEIPLGNLKGESGEKGDKGDAGSFFVPTQVLPIYVDEDGKVIITGDVIVDGNIQTSTESQQIIGDIKDTILEDVDGGTF